LDTKRLEVLKEMIPGLKRVLFSYDPSETFSAAQAKNFRDTSRQLNITLIEKPVRSPKEAQATFASIRRSEVHGIVVPHSLSFNIPGSALEAASRQGIPTMFSNIWFVEQGGLASYGSHYHESGRMAARLVDKIIKGEKPAEIPVEVNHKIEFVVNLKVAKALGIKIAPEALYKANRIIR
jgi:putative ABC transport system substrate-binding protein